MQARNSTHATSIMTKITLIEGRESAFATWQAAFTRTAAMAPGFASIEDRKSVV